MKVSILFLLSALPSCWAFSRGLRGLADANDMHAAIRDVQVNEKRYNEEEAAITSKTKVHRGLLFSQLGDDIDGEAGDGSGWSVAMSADGSRIAIGATFFGYDLSYRVGRVRVYDWIAGSGVTGSWVQVGQYLKGGEFSGLFGSAVAMSADGSRIAVGATGHDISSDNERGYVRVYDLKAGLWEKTGQDIHGEEELDSSGYSVAMSADGNRIAIGAIGNSNNNLSRSGHVRVYDLTAGGSWQQTGQDIDGEAVGDTLGASVAMSADGSRIVIGAPGPSGYVRVYDLTAGSIVQAGQDIDGEVDGDKFGHSVAMSADGNRIAIGAHLNDGSGLNSGHVRVYDWTAAGSWEQAGQDIDGEAQFDSSGNSVAMSADGNRIAIGAPKNDGSGLDSGHVRVYDWKVGTPTGSWEQQGWDIDGEEENDYSGWAVAMSADGNRLAVGARRNDGCGHLSGHVRVYRYSSHETIRFMVCSSAPSRFVINGPSITTGPEHFLPFDGARRNGRRTKEIKGNEMLLPPSSTYKLRRVGTYSKQHTSSPSIVYAEACARFAGSGWYRIAYQVGDYEDSSGGRPIVMSFEVPGQAYDYPVECTIDERDCADLAVDRLMHQGLVG